LPHVLDSAIHFQFDFEPSLILLIAILYVTFVMAFFMNNAG
jgi:hypothetical protein